MCTIGAAETRKGNLIFKNLDPRRDTPFEVWIEQYQMNGEDILVIRNKIGCYGGINSRGIGIVGTFVNIQSEQNNYFDGSNLLDILSIGGLSTILDYLIANDNKLFGNLFLADQSKIWSIELAGDIVNSKLVSRYVKTNHFREIPLQLQTMNDNFIRTWTTSRLERAKVLIKNVDSIDDVKTFLSDHENVPDFSICNHGKIATASSFIIDCTNKCVFYCEGNPCCHEFTKYIVNND